MSEIANSEIRELTKIEGIGNKTANQLISVSKASLENYGVD